MNKHTEMALVRVRRERFRQDSKWGQQNHSIPTWIVILQEEVGELCEAFLKRRSYDVDAELTQVAAVAVAAMESLDRNGFDGKGNCLCRDGRSANDLAHPS